MLKLLLSVFRRIMTAVTSPFRMVLVRLQRMLNINVITAKLVGPLTKQVKKLITLKPQSREDYYVIGRYWVYKKLFLTLVLVLCAGVFLYFTMFASKLPTTAPAVAAVKTDVTYKYNDMSLRSFTGVANIRAADGKVVYTGDIAAGVCTGSGVLRDRGGKLVYEGGFLENRYSGKGVSYYPSGNKKYEGEFADNRYEGQGTLYADDKTVLYTGGFVNGLFDGEGMRYTDSGVLQYEGAFSEGVYHGEGISYYSNGTVRYKGAFFKGAAQGVGALFSPSGKLLYTGDMYAGAINYRSLVYSTLADIEAAFAETPRIFYTDTDSAFVFEQAGVIVSLDCRVRVDTWKKPADGGTNRDYYYMPGSQPDLMPTGAPTRAAASDLLYRPNASPPATAGDLLAQPGGQGLLLRPIDWYVADPQGNISYNYDNSSSSSSSSEASNTYTFTYGSDSSSSSSSSSEDGTIQINPEISVTVPDDSSQPDFITQNNTLYFEIDTNVWQEESVLDKKKVQVQKVTVFAGDIPALPQQALEYSDDAPPSVEDCIAIDFIRKASPTAFPNIMFEMDKQNKLFVRLSNVSYANRIDRRTYLIDELTCRYSFQGSGDKTPRYYSIER